MREHGRSLAKTFRLRAILACGLGAALVFAVLTIFTYDFWTVAVTATLLFLLTAAAVVLWAGGAIPVVNAWIFGAVLFPVGWGLVQIWLNRSVYQFETWQSVMGYAEAACAFW